MSTKKYNELTKYVGAMSLDAIKMSEPISSQDDMQSNLEVPWGFYYTTSQAPVARISTDSINSCLAVIGLEPDASHPLFFAHVSTDGETDTVLAAVKAQKQTKPNVNWVLITAAGATELTRKRVNRIGGQVTQTKCWVGFSQHGGVLYDTQAQTVTGADKITNPAQPDVPLKNKALNKAPWEPLWPLPVESFSKIFSPF